MLRLQVHREFVRRHCIRLLGVVVGCGDEGVDDFDAARFGADGAEFLASVVCLGGNERLDDRTPKGFLAPEGQDQPL